jgi:hypothetical protein
MARWRDGEMARWRAPSAALSSSSESTPSWLTSASVNTSSASALPDAANMCAATPGRRPPVVARLCSAQECRRPGRGRGRRSCLGWSDRTGPALHPAEAFFEEIAISCRSQNRSLQPQDESGSCVVLSGHLAAMMGPPGRPGSVEVGYPPRTPAQARVCAAPGDVPAPCPRGPRGYRPMVRVAIGSAIHHFFPSRDVLGECASYRRIAEYQPVVPATSQTC